jgi:hypothetical protein
MLTRIQLLSKLALAIEDIMSQIVKYDDLYWNADEGKFIAFSEKEIDQICGACLLSGIEDTEDVMKIIHWAELARISELTLKGILSGRLGLILQENEEEPRFYERSNEELEEIEKLEGVGPLYTEDDNEIDDN